MLKTIELQLQSISSYCQDTLKTADKIQPIEQQQRYDKIQKEKRKFFNLAYDYYKVSQLPKKEFYDYMQALILVTYDLDKIANSRRFGLSHEQSILPKEYITIEQLQLEGGCTNSANTVKRGLLPDGTEIFYKDMKPDVAQLEIYSAELFRQMLGSASSHGRIVSKNHKISGMYVEKIPGFISMKELSLLAQQSYPYQEITKKILALEKEIEAILKNTNLQTTKILEDKVKKRLLYIRLQEMRIINEEKKVVDIKKINRVVAKTLCSAFYFEDWDRHKDNWGLSYRSYGLEAASLDYDKSLNKTFEQDNGLYDWDITPKRLLNFPEFNCWYWPTQSRNKLQWIGSFFDAEKSARMYSSDEVAEYKKLKNDPEFRKQTYVEWLKLAVIGLEIHKLGQDFISTSADKKLLQIPDVLERKRKILIDSLVQLDEFRGLIKKATDKDDILNEVKLDLKSTLSSKELELLNESWESITQEIKAKSNAVDKCMKILHMYPLLAQIIEKTNISVNASIYSGSDKKFIQELQGFLLQAADCDDTEKFCESLNNNLGTNVAPKDITDQLEHIKKEIFEVTAKNDMNSELISELLPPNLPEVQVEEFKQSSDSYRQFLLKQEEDKLQHDAEYTARGYPKKLIAELEEDKRQHDAEYTPMGYPKTLIAELKEDNLQHNKESSEYSQEFIAKLEERRRQHDAKYTPMGYPKKRIAELEERKLQHDAEYTPMGYPKKRIAELEEDKLQHDAEYTASGYLKEFLSKQKEDKRQHDAEYTPMGYRKKRIAELEEDKRQHNKKYTSSGRVRKFIEERERDEIRRYLDYDYIFETNMDQKLQTLFALIDPVDKNSEPLIHLLKTTTEQEKRMLSDVIERLYIYAYKECNNIAEEQKLRLYRWLVCKVMQGEYVLFNDKQFLFDKFAKKEGQSIGSLSLDDSGSTLFALKPSIVLMALSNHLQKKIDVELDNNRYTKNNPLNLGDMEKITTSLCPGLLGGMVV